MRLFLCGLLVGYSLSACGHKGPLYLPQSDEGKPILQQESDKK